MTFAVLPGGNRNATQDLPFDLPTRMEMGGAGLGGPVLDAVGISVVDAAAGRVSLPVHPYVHNSIGAVQGGAMALLGDVAAAEALGAATGLGAGGDGRHRPAGGLSDPRAGRAHRYPGHGAGRGRDPGAGAGGASAGDPGPASAVVELHRHRAPGTGSPRWSTPGPCRSTAFAPPPAAPAAIS